MPVIELKQPRSTNETIRLLVEAAEMVNGVSMRMPTMDHLRAALESAGFWCACAKDLKDQLAQMQTLYDLRAQAADEFAEEVIGGAVCGS